MSQAAETLLTVDQFLALPEAGEGKFELHDGVLVAMAPERARHSRTKAFVAAALLAGLKRANARCGVYADGIAVRVRQDRAFIPDVVVVCPPAPDDDVATSTPLIAVEVLSPGTAVLDGGFKLAGYFSLPSLAHYLIIDPDRRVIIHRRRGADGAVEARIVHDGSIRLDPPGVDLEILDLLGPAG